MVDFAIVREWLEKADQDFGFALVNLQEKRPFYAQICFHFHQATEKYLKAYVIAHELEFLKTHDLSMLRQGHAFHVPFDVQIRHWGHIREVRILPDLNNDQSKINQPPNPASHFADFP